MNQEQILARAQALNVQTVDRPIADVHDDIMMLDYAEATASAFCSGPFFSFEG